MTKTANKLHIDVRDGDKIYKIWEFCEHNNFDYKMVPMTLFPIWYRVKFTDPKEHLMATLAV